jgi:hypothetical protein
LIRRSSVKDGDFICLELVSSKSKDVARVNILDAVKALLRMCGDARLDIITTITKHGYRSVIRLSSEDTIRCKNVFKTLLTALLPDEVMINEVSCNEAVVDKVPLYVGLSK